MRQIARTLALGATLAVMAVAGLAGPASAGVDPALNKVSYWQSKTGGTCHKYEFGGGKTSYTLGAAPYGKYWEVLVIKAGTEVKSVWNPYVGKKYYPANRKDISFVIVCFDDKRPYSSY